MDKDDFALNAALQQTQYANQDDFWYSYPNQKKYKFALARELVIQGESIDDALELAQEFVNEFYKQNFGKQNRT